MRVFRILAPLAGIAMLCAAPSQSVSSGASRGPLRAVKVHGPACALYAAPYDANYAYGPKRTNEFGLSALTAPTANISVTYSGFDSTSQAAFQAAVDIWSRTIVSAVPIRIRASFTTFTDPLQIGSAGPTALCTASEGVANTYYAAALADKLHGSAYCAALGGDTAEISASFNRDFTGWDFGTSGVGVAGKYSFMTTVLHELGHGLGFYGSAGVSSGIGSLRSTPDIYDRFAVTGSGTTLLSFANPSAALAAQLVSNDTYFSGTNASSRNSGSRPKLETHNFATFYNRNDTDSGFLAGSSYSHVDDSYSESPNGLMTWQIASNEVYTDPGPIVRGIFEDLGWTLASSSGCSYTLGATSASVGASGGSSTVSVTTTSGCAWTATSNASYITITAGQNGNGSGTVSYTVAANTGLSQRIGTITIAGQTFTVSQAGTGPTVSLDKTSLQFGATSNGAKFMAIPSAQTVRLTQSGGTAAASWTATSSKPWLVVSPASGTGSATLSISVQFSSTLPVSGTASGTISLSFTGAANSAGPITVGLTVMPAGASAAPFGSFDTPANNTTGIVGSIPVTGWALDDVEVTSVSIYRDAVSGEASGLVFIGNAALVDGARPDVAATYSAYPRSTRAGWGYLMLTNFLPSLGNGTFRLSAYAGDAEGHSTLLGTKTITCDNAHSTSPFGAIDTPGQGETVSGTVTNFGWVLSPGTARADPPGGGTVSVVVDGVIGSSPSGWTSRSDLTALFPVSSYSGINTALGVAGISTTALTNGVHTLQWLVTDNQGKASGIGSRYFTVSNGSSLSAALTTADAAAGQSAPAVEIATAARLDDSALRRNSALRAGNLSTSLRDEVAAASLDASAIDARRGFDLDVPFRRVRADASGVITVQSEEIDRVELRLSPDGWHKYSGYLRAAGDLAPLPVGSHLDPATGTFTWQPGVGFVGAYDFVFVRWVHGRAIARQEIRIVLNPKGSGRVGAQVVIDVPSVVASGFRRTDSVLLAGWAADLDAEVGTGIDALHVWAYPIDDGRYGNAFFLGEAATGGKRPDVAAIYGDQFRDSGYGLIVRDLPPGEYDIAVFAHRTFTGTFLAAKLVRVTVN